VTSREHKPATAAPPGGEGWQAKMPGLDRRDRRFRRSLRRQIVLAASTRQGTKVGAIEQKEVVVAFEYQQGTHGRSPRRRWGRRQRILLGLQAATLVVVAAGVLVVSRPPADQRPTAQELLGRALRVLDAHPGDVVMHQVVTESGLQQSWPDLSDIQAGATSATPSNSPRPLTVTGLGHYLNETVCAIIAGSGSTAANSSRYPATDVVGTSGQDITVTGSGFTPNGKVRVTFNAPYTSTGVPVNRSTTSFHFSAAGMDAPSAPGQLTQTGFSPNQAVTLTVLSSPRPTLVTLHADVCGMLSYPALLEASWAFDDKGTLYSPGPTPFVRSAAKTITQTTLPSGVVVRFIPATALPRPARIESWRQLDRSGVVVRAALVARDASGMLLRQVVIDDQSVTVYNASGTPSVHERSSSQRMPQFWLAGQDQGRNLVATPALQAARGVLLAMQHDTQARLLPEQRLDGHDVVVLASTGPVRPDFSRQVREEQRLYIDAQSYQVRGYDAIALERNLPPRLLYSVRVPIDEQLAQGDVPLDAYRFSPPTGTPLTAPRCENPPIAPAAAAYGGITPLIPSGYDGMKLQMLFSTQSPAGAVGITYLYQPSAPASESLEVALLHGGTSGAETGSAAIAPPLIVNMSGRRVRGVLVRTTPTSNEYTFSYSIGDSTIAVKGTNLGLPRFMRLLGALRSGQAAVLLQDRLGNDLAAAGIAGTATGC